MPQLTLNSNQVSALATFVKKHNLKTFFLAKDEGAYVGATGGDHDKGTFENILFYFKGMDPSKEKYDMEAYDNARYAFGGDDFGQQLDAEFILQMSEKSQPKVTIKVTATAVTMNGTFAKDAPAPTPEVKAKKQTKGERIRKLLANNISEAVIVAMVETTLNSVRWHKSQMSKTA